MAFQSDNIPYSVYCGLDLPFKSHLFDKNLIFNFITSLPELYIDYLICNVSVKDNEQRLAFPNCQFPVFLDEFMLLSYEWRDKFVTKIHSEDFDQIEDSLDVLINDIDFSNHINSRYTYFPNNINVMKNLPILVKLLKKFNPDTYNKFILIEFDFSEESYYDWTKLTSFLGYQDNVGVCLKLTSDLPSDKILKIWCSQNVKAVKIPLSIFLTNKNGYPVLSKMHQDYLKIFMFHKTDIIIEDDTGNFIESPLSLLNIKDYVLYINHIFKNHRAFDNKSMVVNNYLDFFQIPLQPLRDNLQSQTYEIFEDDSIKYEVYQNAVRAAMTNYLKFGLINLDNIKNAKDYKFDQERVLIFYVVGAGRGPLLKKAVEICWELKINYKIFAVEKNKNAYNTLIYLRQAEPKYFFENCEIICGDMRTYVPNHKIDVIISELLGSFGDNESSPECLINIQQYLSNDSIMIPHSYTSYIRPVSCPVIWKNIRKTKEYTYENPYVILLHTCYFPINELEKCFEFVHPIEKSSLNQYKNIQFKFEENIVIHGFSGYFHSTLYGDVFLSTRPEDHTEGMLSWFPMYFPIINPLELKAGDVMNVSIWRENDGRKVWYEWSIANLSSGSSNFFNSQIQNSQGKSYSILL